MSGLRNPSIKYHKAIIMASTNAFYTRLHNGSNNRYATKKNAREREGAGPGKPIPGASPAVKTIHSLHGNTHYLFIKIGCLYLRYSIKIPVQVFW